MARTQGKSGLVVTIIVLGVILLVVGGIVVAKNLGKSNAPSSTATSQKDAATTKDASTTATDATETPAATTTTPAADPSTLSSIDVEPLGISVSYTKGVPGFEFSVEKTADQTQYVEFTSDQLVGTKCTNDNGLFVSIIKNPSSDENQTISQTMKIGSDTYGLSLAGQGCTSDTDLLNQYQAAFTNGFSSLKSL